MSGLFWSDQPRSMTKAEAEQFRSPEETGRRLVDVLRAWLARALRELPAEARAYYRVELDPPEGLDSGYPHLALNECRRLVNGIPDAAPGWMDWTSEQARAVSVLHGARAAIAATASIPAPAALVLLERALDLGIKLAQAHVEPWEACADLGNNQLETLRRGRDNAHGTPEQRAALYRAMQKELETIMGENPRWKVTAAREEMAQRNKGRSGYSLRNITDHTKDPSKI